MTAIANERLPNLNPLRISVDQYHRMLKAGLLAEGAPIELLDGSLVLIDRSHLGEDLMSVGPDHASTVDILPEVFEGLKSFGCRLRLQQPITLPLDGEPQPDGAIVRNVEHRYRNGHPGPADVFCVIEVADSSLETDRTTKLRIYAEAGVPQYVIINLVDRVVEDYRGPRPADRAYAAPVVLNAGETVEFACGEGKSVGVAVHQLSP